MFSLAYRADENITIIFVGLARRRKCEHIFVGRAGRRKYLYFHRLPTKIKLFLSTLFRQPNFIGRLTKIAIFDSFPAIFIGFWPMKLHYFPVVMARKSQGSRCWVLVIDGDLRRDSYQYSNRK
jgi:hypothetical protein